MEDRKKIEDKLRKKEQEIEALEDRLKAARVYIQALQDVLKMLDADDGEGAATLRAGSTVEQARKIILKAQRPLHINALLEALGKDQSRESRASLTSSLAAYVRRGEIFTRPAPNTFGLSELGHDTSEETGDEGPPAGFGKIPAAANAPPAPRPDPFSRQAAPSRVAPKPASFSEMIDDDIPF